MTLKTEHVQQLEVFMSGTRVGALAQSRRGQIWFEYDTNWLSTGWALSPMPHFQLRNGAFKASNHVFDGLHGVFHDALPDGWGLLLMDRAMKKILGWDPHEITPLDRLAYIGRRAMGALEFRPVLSTPTPLNTPSLDRLAEEALLVQEGLIDDVLGALYIQGGSPGGARPKVTVAMQAQGSDRLLSGFETIPDSFDHWMIKFRSHQTDPHCMGRIELAYARMAELAKVHMPPTRLVSASIRGGREDFFAVKRFDREKNQKKHVLSLGALLEASHREPCLDYTQLLKAVLFVTKDVQEVAHAYRWMVFNVLAHNKDDHVKNFAFIYEEGRWRLTPAFDLTFSGGMNNQHTTAIAGQGNPRLEHIKHVALSVGLKEWASVVEEVFEAVSQWKKLAHEYGVRKNITLAYASAIESGAAFAEIASQRLANNAP